MQPKTQYSWNSRFDNPWKDRLQNKTLTLRDIVAALQWGAPADRLTSEIKEALQQVK